MLSGKMKSRNAKRIVALAASLALGIAVAGPVSFSNIPIINSAGQPVVQIVVGSTAQPSDGVVAANIAAVIGNMAFTSQPVTASVSGTSGLSCAVTAPTCTLSNQQVWLGEKGTVTASGSFTIQALIGSYLNGGNLNYQNLANTKTAQSGTNNQYAYPDASSGPWTITSSPTATSAWAGVGLSGVASVTADTNGGGFASSAFTSSAYDNVVRLSQTQVPGLLASSGTNAESEYLWLAGFPVYDQASGVASFQLLDTQGAYQAQFGNPIISNTTSHPSFTLLGQNWSLYKVVTYPTAATYPTSSQFIIGGKVQLAQQATKLQTVYVGHNITSGPITVVLQDLSYPTSGGFASASLGVYKNGVFANQTSVFPGNTVTVNASGTMIFINVPTTFPGLYSYQKWAKIQLFSNIFNITSQKVFNGSTNNNWYANLQWTTNMSTAASSYKAFEANAYLEGIVLYSNQSKTTNLGSGQTFSFIQDPAKWKVSFAGDSLGAPGSSNNNYDPLSFSTDLQSSMQYQNLATGAADAQSVTSNGFQASGFSFGAYPGPTNNAIVSNAVVAGDVGFLTSATPYNVVYEFNVNAGGAAPNSNAGFSANTEIVTTTGNAITVAAISSIPPQYKYVSYYVSNTAGGTALYYAGNTPITGGSTSAFNIATAGPTTNATVLQASISPMPTAEISGVGNTLNTSFVTQPVNLFEVSSTLSTPFQVVPNDGSQAPNANGNGVNYILDAYKYTVQNVIAANSNSITSSPNYGMMVQMQANGGAASLNGNYISNTNPLTVTIDGYKAGSSGLSTPSVTFKNIAVSPGSVIMPSNGIALQNVTNIQLGYPLPLPGVTVNVWETANTANVVDGNNDILMGTLNYEGPVIEYKTTQYPYQVATNANSLSSTGATVYYTAGSQTNMKFLLDPSSIPGNTVQRATYFTYNVPMVVIPSQTAAGANVTFDITNSSTILSNPGYWLNQTNSNGQEWEYFSNSGNGVKMPVGFRDERGGELASLSNTGATYDMAKSVDVLQLLVGPSNSTVSSTTQTFGPYKVGQATNIANVSIAAVNGTCSFASTASNCAVSGVSNLTATPSVSSAVVPVKLDTSSTPLAVLDSNANNASTLIVVGSKYVNSVAAQLFAQNPSFDSSFGPSSVVVQAFGTSRILVAGYTANQTVQAGNQFIQDLLSGASS